MVSTRSQKGQSTSNAVTPKVSRPVKTKAPKIGNNAQPPRKRLRTAISDVEAPEPTSFGDSAVQPASALQNLLLGLPVEIFGEICSFLDAIDLRHLSLTDETFWSVLVSPKSDSIWRRAFGRVVPPMPECPETMSGPDYARFMLVDSCMVCQQKSWTHCFDYFHRVRYCDSCHRPNIISKTTILRSYPDFPPEFLQYLSSDAVGSDDASLANHRSRWHGSKRQYHKVTVGEVYKLWKSLSENLALANPRLTERLQKYADNRIKSGLKMYAWHMAARECKRAELAKIKEERTASIRAKLSELGHQEIDFPRWHVEVNKSVALTDEEWERIRPVIEGVAESNKSSRIWSQGLRRRNERSRALNVLWNGAVAVASGTRAVYHAERSVCPNFNEFLGLPPAAELIAADTDGISAADQDSIRPQAVQFAIQGRRRILTKLHNMLKGLPLDQTNEEEWSSLSNDEVIARLDTIAAELAQAVNGFWDSKRKVVDWYPSTYFRPQYLDPSVLSPAQGLAPGLIAKMLESIEKSPDTEAGAVTNWHWRKPVQFRCARCDERVAPYLTFSDMISHFLEKKVWFDKASLAREKALAENLSLSHHTFFNDHDWNSEGDLIVTEISHDKARVTRLQTQLEAAYGNDPEDYDGEDFTTRSRRSAKQKPERRTRRICRLCPEGFAPQPMYFATLKIHIERIHCKGANVEQDTAAFVLDRDSRPENPCVFDVPFLSL